jgi:hypothetical protein
MERRKIKTKERAETSCSRETMEMEDGGGWSDGPYVVVTARCHYCSCVCAFEPF